MKVTYDIELPEIVKQTRKRAEEYYKLVDFVGSEHKTMCIEYEDEKKAISKMTTVRSLVKDGKFSHVRAKRLDNKIYFIKEDKNKKGK